MASTAPIVLAIVVVLCSVGGLFASPYISAEYPLYKQCNPLWGNDLMGGNNTSEDTVCIQGCAMTSVAMALCGKGYSMPDGTVINPGTLNHWLRVNGYYLNEGGDPNNLNLTAPNLIDPGFIHFISEKEKPSEDVMRKWVDHTNPVMIAHVRDDGHFVLITGYDTNNSSVFHVNDPYYNTTVYLYKDMSDLILYSVVNITQSQNDAPKQPIRFHRHQ